MDTSKHIRMWGRGPNYEDVDEDEGQLLNDAETQWRKCSRIFIINSNWPIKATSTFNIEGGLMNEQESM